MKKTIFTIVIMVFAVTIASSQLVSKKGVPILPEKDEYALGVDATPFFNYFGNMFNGNVNNTGPAFNFTATTPMTIYVKRMVDANTAYRAKFRIGMASANIKNNVTDDVNVGSDPMAVVEDKWAHSEMFIQLGFGIEKRRGKGRVQGIYGAEAALGIMSVSDKYTFGNSITSANNNPTSTNWSEFGGWNWANMVNPPTWSTQTPGSRTLEQKQGMGFGIAARAFGGIEYFFAPKMSIGGEFGWSIAFVSMGKSKTTTESWDNTAVKEVEQEQGGRGVFRIDTDNMTTGYSTTSPVLAGPSGAINLFFYF